MITAVGKQNLDKFKTPQPLSEFVQILREQDEHGKRTVFLELTIEDNPNAYAVQHSTKHDRLLIFNTKEDAEALITAREQAEADVHRQNTMIRQRRENARRMIREREQAGIPPSQSTIAMLNEPLAKEPSEAVGFNLYKLAQSSIIVSLEDISRGLDRVKHRCLKEFGAYPIKPQIENLVNRGNNKLDLVVKFSE